MMAMVAVIFRSRFLMQVAGGSLAVAVLWKIAEFRGWTVDTQSAILMFAAASVFGFILGLVVRPRPQVRKG